MLPLLGFGVIATQAAVRIIAKRTFRAPLVAGYLALIAGALLLLFVQPASPLALIVAGLSLVGIANGCTNMGLQTALYLHVKQEDTGAASGLFLTFRSLGSIVATSLIGIVYGAKVSMSGLHILVLVIVLCGVGLAIAGFSRRLA
jgi:predicted MFS family arabinose efflux permease